MNYSFNDKIFRFVILQFGGKNCQSLFYCFFTLDKLSQVKKLLAPVRQQVGIVDVFLRKY